MSKRQPEKTKITKAASVSAAELHAAARVARRSGASPAEVSALLDQAAMAERAEAAEAEAETAEEA